MIEYGGLLPFKSVCRSHYTRFYPPCQDIFYVGIVYVLCTSVFSAGAGLEKAVYFEHGECGEKLGFVCVSIKFFSVLHCYFIGCHRRFHTAENIFLRFAEVVGNLCGRLCRLFVDLLMRGGNFCRFACRRGIGRACRKALQIHLPRAQRPRFRGFSFFCRAKAKKSRASFPPATRFHPRR